MRNGRPPSHNRFRWVAFHDNDTPNLPNPNNPSPPRSQELLIPEDPMPPPPPIPSGQITQGANPRLPPGVQAMPDLRARRGVTISNTMDFDPDYIRRRMIREDPSSDSDPLFQSLRQNNQNRMANANRQIEQNDRDVIEMYRKYFDTSGSDPDPNMLA